MFALRACVMGVDSGMETPLSHGENQKIYCTSISAIRLRHVGLHAARTGWKIESHSPVPTMETLKDVLWISIFYPSWQSLKLPTQEWRSLERKMREKCFFHFAGQDVLVWQERCSTTALEIHFLSSQLAGNCTQRYAKADTLTVNQISVPSHRVGVLSTSLSAAQL